MAQNTALVGNPCSVLEHVNVLDKKEKNNQHTSDLTTGNKSQFTTHLTVNTKQLSFVLQKLQEVVTPEIDKGNIVVSVHIQSDRETTSIQIYLEGTNVKPFDFGNSSFANAKNGRGFVRKNSMSNIHCGFGRLYSPRRYRKQHNVKKAELVPRKLHKTLKLNANLHCRCHFRSESRECRMKQRFPLQQESQPSLPTAADPQRLEACLHGPASGETVGKENVYFVSSTTTYHRKWHRTRLRTGMVG